MVSILKSPVSEKKNPDNSDISMHTNVTKLALNTIYHESTKKPEKPEKPKHQPIPSQTPPHQTPQQVSRPISQARPPPSQKKGMSFYYNLFSVTITQSTIIYLI
jgi:hypothetical protein